MNEHKKTLFSLFFIVMVSALFILCAMIINKSRADDTGANKDDEPGIVYEGEEKIYKDGNDYLVRTNYSGFSQNAVIEVRFSGDMLTGVEVLSTEGIPSYYDERALGEEYLSRFRGRLSTDPDVDDADRDFIEIDLLSENDKSGTEMLNCVDRCCKAYYETILKKGGES